MRHQLSQLPRALAPEARFLLLQRNALPLLLTAAVGSPDLACDVSGTVIFKPTCLGASTQRALTLHNPSCIAAHYQVRLLCYATAFGQNPWTHCILNTVLAHSQPRKMADQQAGPTQSCCCSTLQCNGSCTCMRMLLCAALSSCRDLSRSRRYPALLGRFLQPS